jgi:HK97 family phage portal protein
MTAKMTAPPVPLSPQARRRGLSFDLGVGSASKYQQLRAYGMSGTVFSIVSLLQQAAATPRWHLYKKQPQDGRRRYTTGDQGSDQRTEVINHAALSLWNKPNDFHTGFEFREGSNQHLELTGETFWVLNRDNAFGMPTSAWYVRPDRMEPVTDPDAYLLGWVYTGPNSEQVPLTLEEVILERLPDPIDPFRGAGPVGSVMPNIQQQRYATEYQRNLFLNGATPGGIIMVPNKLTDPEFDELVDRWREGHQGVARAGRVGVLENGAQWLGDAPTNKDMEYTNLRLANRDELREAWRIHKHMLGTVDDVNRANAMTAEDTFTGWQTIPRLERRKDTLNCKLLPMFGDDKVEFDYEDPSQVNQGEANAELLAKAQSAEALVTAGFDPHDVLEAVGLPDMGVIEKATQEPALPPGWVPAPPALPSAAPSQQPDDSQDVANYLKRLVGLNGHSYAGGQR